ncbi:hypothetical protein [Brevundimonas sp.]|uniref:hypothetical protein n=1 Tax=Brevundimonas sp. TaxID=1871086 RepID=UPI0025E10360|nr:hypothetical protein [Brevundimonas sp.]
MTSRPTALERAFQLAASGAHTGAGSIREALRAEGYAIQQITGGVLTRQLRKLCDEARAPTGAGGPEPA